MANKSKNKGSNFEREVASFLSEKYDKSFTRVPYSGSFIGGKNSYRKNTLTEGQTRSFKGDIIPPDDWTYFNCECKFYESFPFHSLYTKNPLLEKWIDQMLDAADPDDMNIIIFKVNYQGRFIVFDADEGFMYTGNVTTYEYNGEKYKICDMEDFFNRNPHSFQDRCNKHHKTRYEHYHLEEKPKLVTRDNGIKEWVLENGELHREDGPVFEEYIGSTLYPHWYLHDEPFSFRKWCKNLSKTKEEIVQLKLKYGIINP